MFEKTLEERPITTSAASPGEPAVKPLGLGTEKVRGDERGTSVPM